MIRLQIESIDDGEGAASFYRWLSEDAQVRRALTVALDDAEAGPGQMGAADVLSVIMTQLTGIGSLAVAFAAWRDSRARTPTVKFTLGGGTIECGAESVEQLTAALVALADKQAAVTTPEDGGADPDAVA